MQFDDSCGKFLWRNYVIRKANRNDGENERLIKEGFFAGEPITMIIRGPGQN